MYHLEGWKQRILKVGLQGDMKGKDSCKIKGCEGQYFMILDKHKSLFHFYDKKSKQLQHFWSELKKLNFTLKPTNLTHPPEAWIPCNRI